MAFTGDVGKSNTPDYGNFSFGEDQFDLEDSSDVLGGFDFDTYIAQPDQGYSEKKVYLSPERFKQLNPEMDVDDAFVNNEIETIALRRFDNGSAQVFGLEGFAENLEGLNLEFQDLDDMGNLVIDTLENHQFSVVELNKEQYSRISSIALNAIYQASGSIAENGIEGIKEKNIQTDASHDGIKTISELSKGVIENSAISKLSARAKNDKMKQEEIALEEIRSERDAVNALDQKSKRIKLERTITDDIKDEKKSESLDFEKKKRSI